MYCEKCGKKNETSARFCENCGSALKIQVTPKGKPFRIIFPAVVSLVSAIVFSLVAVGIIIFVIVAVTQAISMVSFIPIDLYGLGGNSVVFFTIAIVLSIFLPLIIINYLAFKGLWDSEASGYKWGLLSAFYALLLTLTYFSLPVNWLIGLLLCAIPTTSIICLLMDDNLVKFTNNPIEIVMPAIISLTSFFGILHGMIISTVTFLFSLISTAKIRSLFGSLSGLIPNFSSTVSTFEVFIIILVIIIIALIILFMFLFYKLYKSLLNRQPKVYMLGIVLYTLITILLLIFFVESKYINIFGFLLILVFAAQAIFLSLKSTRILLNN
jgi:hypothetical protein